MKKALLLIAIAIISRFLVSCVKEPESCFTATSDSLDNDNNPRVGEKISFENCSAEADSYLWDFGDGETSTKENPTHTYAEGGNFNVTLEVTNKKGSTTSDFDIEVLSLTDNLVGQWALTEAGGDLEDMFATDGYSLNLEFHREGESEFCMLAEEYKVCFMGDWEWEGESYDQVNLSFGMTDSNTDITVAIDEFEGDMISGEMTIDSDGYSYSGEVTLERVFIDKSKLIDSKK
jgi:PKD repeat protein